MKRLLVSIGSAALIVAALFFALGTITSAFDFSIYAREILPIWAGAALLISVLVTRYRLAGLVLCLIPIVAVVAYRLDVILTGARHVLFIITNEYGKWLQIPILFPGARAGDYELMHFWGALGLCLMPLLSIAACIRRSGALMVFLTLPLLFPAFVLSEFAPDAVYPAGLMTVCLAMLVCSALHPEDYMKRGLAIFPALALAAALSGAAYLAAPPDTFVRGDRIDSFDDWVRDLIRGTPAGDLQVPDSYSGDWYFNTDRVDIFNAGSRNPTGRGVLEVTSSIAGTFYLRGFAMREFDGRAWIAPAETSPLDTIALMSPAYIAGTYGRLFPDDAPETAHMTITRLSDRTDVDSYMPYYSVSFSDNGADFHYTRSSIPVMAAALPPESLDASLPEYNSIAQKTYTHINNHTASELRRLASQMGIDAKRSRAEIADQVAEYVTSAARYSLRPPEIPKDEEFVTFFLQTSRQGYCIHFATAATLMLRALDIPARFTSGFIVNVSEAEVGAPVVITDEMAHAWVEVYYDDIGWVPLEATPASTRSIVPARVPHSDIAETQAPEETPDEDEDASARPSQEQEPETSPSATPSATPGAASGKPEAPKTSTSIGGILIAAGCAALCIAAVILRVYIAKRRREARFSQPDANAAVLYVWRYIRRVNRRAQPPEELETLALKARFSQHRISEEERGTMIGYASSLYAQTREQSGLARRLIMKYIRGL